MMMTLTMTMKVITMIMALTTMKVMTMIMTMKFTTGSRNSKNQTIGTNKTSEMC